MSNVSYVTVCCLCTVETWWKQNLKRKFHTWISSDLVKGTEYESQDLASSPSRQPKQFEKQCAYLSILDSSLSRRQCSGSSEANTLWLHDWFCHYCSWNTGRAMWEFTKLHYRGRSSREMQMLKLYWTLWCNLCKTTAQVMLL